MIYQAFCYLWDTDVSFAAAYQSIPFGDAGTFLRYNPLRPLDKHEKLIKFTHGRRFLHTYFQFPLIYGYAGTLALSLCACHYYTTSRARGGGRVSASEKC